MPYEHLKNIRRLLKEMKEIREKEFAQQLKSVGHSEEQAKEMAKTFFNVLEKELENQKKS